MGDTPAIPPFLSLAEARAVLGLDRTDGPSPGAAFRAAAKASHPDRAGGDAERFRRVVEAWTVVRAADPGTPRHPLPTPAPVLRLTPMQALRGGEVNDGSHRLDLPAGLRSGDWVRGANRQRLVVLVQPADGLSLVGDDLYMDWAVDPRRLTDGGRIEIQTHAGVRPSWIAPGGGTGRLRLGNLGLPARGSRPQGHLFVALKPCAEAVSEAEDLLLRFSRVWTPARRAA